MKVLAKIKRAVIGTVVFSLIIQASFLSVLLTPQKVQAASDQVFVAPASKDARIEESDPDNNLNTVTLAVKSDVGDNKRTLIQFGLESLSIPEGATIDEATFSLFMYDAPGAVRTYGAYRLIEDWDENLVTWNNIPSLESLPSAVKSVGTDNDEWLTWNVTSDIVDFLNNPDSNFGWLIKDLVEDSPTGREGQFRSSNYDDDPALQPFLKIGYSTKPTSTITSPVANTSYNAETWPGDAISGTCETPLAQVDKVEVAISDGANYWDGATWSSLDPFWQEVDDLNTEDGCDWFFEFIPDKDGVFKIQSRATDSEGGQEGDDMIEGVVYDTTNPTKPVNTPPAGTYLTAQNVTLTTTDNLDASPQIYYTLDGSEATNTSTLYSGPILISSEIEKTINLRARAYDEAGNASTELDVNYKIAPPEISRENAQNISERSVTITWTTDHPTTSQVVYDTTSHIGDPVATGEVLHSECVTGDNTLEHYGYAFSTCEKDDSGIELVTDHSVTITGLVPGTTYFFRTISHGSPIAISSEKTFATTAIIALASALFGAPTGNDVIIEETALETTPATEEIKGDDTTQAQQKEVKGESTSTEKSFWSKYGWMIGLGLIGLFIIFFAWKRRNEEEN